VEPVITALRAYQNPLFTEEHIQAELDQLEEEQHEDGGWLDWSPGQRGVARCRDTTHPRHRCGTWARWTITSAPIDLTTRFR
jgi:hypothetical protein